MDEKTIRLPPPIATEKQALFIRSFLLKKKTPFNKYATEAVLEKIERDGGGFVKGRRGSP